MTSSFSLFTSVLIYSAFQIFKFNSSEENSYRSGKKSNVCSKVIYLFGVLLFLYRFERQPWRKTGQPLRLVFDAFSVLLAFEFLYSFLWQRVEYFFLEVVPAVVNDTLRSFELFSSQAPAEWPYVVPLLFISILFLTFAHNSDIYIDYYLQLDDSLYESDRSGSEALDFYISSVVPMTSGGFGEPMMGRAGSLLQSPSFPQAHSSHTPATGVLTRERGTHTLTDAPRRRSERLQNRSYP